MNFVHNGATQDDNFADEYAHHELKLLEASTTHT